MSTPAAGRAPALSFIFVTLVIAIVGMGLLIPVLPKLVVEFNHGDVASGSSSYGWLISIFSLMQFVASPILGALSDRFGRRKVILIATAGSAIDYVIMANAPTMTWLFVARLISGVTAGILATANAYIVDVTPAEKRAQAFGLLGAAFGVGFIIGPVVGGFLGNISLRLPFWFAAGCSALNWLWGFFVLPESLKPEHKREFDWKRANPVGALLALKRIPAVFNLVEAYFILMFSQTMLQSIWALYMDKRYGWGPRDVGLSLGFAGLLTILVQAVLIRRIVPRLGETRSVVIGFSIGIAAQLCYGFASHGWMVYAIICLGAFAGIGSPALQSYITRHVPHNEQGAVQGVLMGLTSMANIPGPFVSTHSFSWAVAAGQPAWLAGLPFFEAAALLLIAMLLTVRSFRRDTTAAVAPSPAGAPAG
jgi:DHA1 family tetracycline resistance protein-like MFS transporter